MVNQPNVRGTVIFMSDEHNPAFCSAYGNQRIKTPNMQRMADHGTLFENAYCPSPLCLPSRSAYLAGQRAHALQTYNNCMVNVEKHVNSFANALVLQDVHVCHIGKLDVYEKSHRVGFSEVIVPVDRKYPSDRQIQRKPLAIRPNAAQRANAYGPREEAQSRDKEKMDAAVDWIMQTAPTLQKPFVLCVHIGKPHFPCSAPPKYWRLYEHMNNMPAYGTDVETAKHPYAQDLRAHFITDQFTPEQVQGLRGGYCANISFVDDEIGRVMDALETVGLMDTTNLIYTADHGDMMGKFGMWWKSSLYEDSVKIPLVAMGPDFEKGKRVKTPVDLHDVQATLFKITGTVQPKGFLGTPLQTIPVDDENKVVFSEYHGHGTRSSAYMIRKGPYKLIFYADGPHQLFHVQNDPDELHNLFHENKQKAEELTNELYRICDPMKENDRAEAFIQNQLINMPQQ